MHVYSATLNKMTEERFDFITTDGTRMSIVRWDYNENPRAIIAIVHGHGEHKDRYKHVAEYFGRHNINTWAFDHRGHGQSEGRRGHCPVFNLLIDDVEQFLMQIRNVHNDIPIILYGHSMGGNIAANYLIRRKGKEIKAAIITDPLFKIAFEPPKWKVSIGKLMADIWPSLAQPTGLDVKHLSTDISVVEAYTKDPLVHNKMSAKLFVDIFKAAKFAIEKAMLLPTPTLVMHGEADQITSPEGSKEFAVKNAEMITLKLWPGMYHEIHNEVDKELVFNYELDWINRQLAD